MRIILDTNVLISGLLTPSGNCGQIVRMITSEQFCLCIDARILSEYHEVIRRPDFDIDSVQADIVLDYIETTAEYFAAAPLETSLPDRDDESFLEVAIAARADCVVTGNLKHFPGRQRSGIRVLSPAEFLEFYRKRLTE